MQLTRGYSGWLGAETAISRRVGAERAEEVDLAEGGPVRIAEVKFRIRALPEQEATEPLLAGGPDDQVGVRLAGRVQVFGDVLHVQDLGQLLDRGAPGRVVLQQRADRVGDLPPPAVADRNVDQRALIGAGLSAGVLQHLDRLARQHVQRAHRVHPALPGDQALDGALDDAEQRVEFAGGPLDIFGRKQPQGDHLDAGFPAPADQLEYFIGTLTVTVAHVEKAGGSSPPPVPVAHDAYMARNRVGRERGLQPALIQTVDQVTKSHAAAFLGPGKHLTVSKERTGWGPGFPNR